MIIGEKELTIESIQDALREYVSFTPGNNTASEAQVSSSSNLVKGQTIEKVMSLYGVPKGLETSNECGLEITKCNFQKDGQKISAVFAEGVLVKYSISSQ